MRLFITGSAGFIGSKLIAELQKNKNFQITAHTRSDGLLTDKKYLKKALASQEVIIHLAAMLNPWGKDWPEFIKNNVLPTENLIKCAPKSLKQFIFISTVHVLGVKHKNSKLPLNENSPYQPSTKYSQSKVVCEKILLKAGQKGFPFTILRPAVVYGPGDKKGMVPKIIKLIKSGRMILPCSGQNQVHFIYIDDLIRGIMAAIGNPKALGQIFILAGPKSTKIKNFIKQIQDLLKAKKTKSLPYPVSYLAARFFSIIARGSKEPIIHPDRLDIMCGNRAFSIQKAEKYLGWHPQVNYQKGLKAIIKPS
jgi:nucleoside-diphosphate-sugar epimerase